MTDDARVSSDVSMPSNASSSASTTSKQRRKRKWDQPAETVAVAGLAVPGILPLGSMGFVGPTFSASGITSLAGSALVYQHAASNGVAAQVLQAPLIQQQATAALQKLIQPKIQDELIAREIVINDAESSVRYKLTKRPMQEEIQKCTGAVVITRGKYRPANAPDDREKPLYLHISAGAHLKETAERIKAVDHAAAMVEEMLKQGPNSLQAPSVLNNGVKALSACVFLGFDADPALNIAARIRGPNDQYINHIMNETGATVLLRGCNSGNPESSYGDEQQTLHLLLSSNNPKSLEDAKLLAENLLDTISAECGATRVSPSKVYTAVPPPQQLLDGSMGTGSIALPASVVSSTGSSIILPQARLMNSGQPHTNVVCYSQPSLPSGTSYNGYGGIYPQATPLQQVALALRQSHTPLNSTALPVTAAANTSAKPCLSSSPEKEKRPPQRRKFQELSVASKGPAKLDQGYEFAKPCHSTEEVAIRNISSIPAPNKLVQPSPDGKMKPPFPRSMPPPPSKTMPPPPPPPKFTPPTPLLKPNDSISTVKKAESNNVPDTLIKLMEYGEEDDDPEEEVLQVPPKSDSDAVTTSKPFWAV